MKEDLVDIYKNARGVLILMLINMGLGLLLFVFSMLNLNPNAAVVKIGYGDIGGYRDGTWTSMLAFPLLALAFGFLHGVVAVRVYHKRGVTMTKFFLMTTTFLIMWTFVVLVRLLGEGS